MKDGGACIPAFAGMTIVRQSHDKYMKGPVRLPITIYQRVIRVPMNMLLGKTNSCRFQPTCSQYVKEAINKHGIIKGLFLGMGRMLRCHPFGRFGYDPVP